MYYVYSVVILCLFIFNCSAGTSKISVPERNFQNEAVPTLHMTLLSIEDKLRNLENAVEGKIEFYGRKIDNIEKDLTRFQVFMRMELDKISENISNKNYKDDYLKDRTIRKIETIYERINHKLTNIEGQIEMTNMKSQNTREILVGKFDKMEESLTIRDADMEAELGEAVSAIDDLRITCTSIEENIVNTTRDFTKALVKNTEKLNKKQHIQTTNMLEETNRTLAEGIVKIQNSLNLLSSETTNASTFLVNTKEEFDESLNDYANKLTDMYSDLWKRNDLIHTVLVNIAKVTNLTRSEQQNGLRALMVQVGRKTGKNVQSDSTFDNQKLIELSKKIDSNFENIMLTQNLFLESCHRVQMDESQIESQISIVLNKLIDVFQNKTSVGPKDIEQLELLIRTHDSNIRKSIYHVTNNLLSLVQKSTDHKVEILDYISNQRLQLDSIYVLLQHTLSSNDSEKIQNALFAIQTLQKQLNETYNEIKTSNKQTNLTNDFLNKLLHTTQDNIQLSNLKLKNVFEFIKNIYHVLTSIEMKVNKSYLDYYFNKYNIEVIAHRFGKKLHDYIKDIDATNLTNTTQFEDTHNKTIPELILEIFGEDSSKSDPYDDYPYTISSNASKSEEDVHNVVLLCPNKTGDCVQLNNTKYDVVKQNETECENGECTPQTSKSPIGTTTQSNETETSNSDCLPNYVGLIDVRSNYGSNCSINLPPINSSVYEENGNITYDYDIDVRYISANNSAPNGTATVNQQTTTDAIPTERITTEESLTSTTTINEILERTTDEAYSNLEEEAEANEFEYTNHEYH